MSKHNSCYNILLQNYYCRNGFFSDEGWAAFSEGNGQTLDPPKPSPNSLLWIGLCLVLLAIVGLIIVLLILYRRSRGETKIGHDDGDKLRVIWS
ncbi:hypothetical protein KIN20_018277 [Parelaphostrongylus tenuis]|uniref:Uncharacterized protein n=1 Tax=Parelaphostrongylus tenuis TaxID=148309 RepID=A0AAD5N7A7_PARTN|nr:hypothetical protein KIN20_018277 [Parelaphostrongylus tenuis]